MLRWRREKKKEKKVSLLQSAYAQELKKIVRVIGGLCINSERLDDYMNGLRENYKKNLYSRQLAILLVLL